MYFGSYTRGSMFNYDLSPNLSSSYTHQWGGHFFKAMAGYQMELQEYSEEYMYKDGMLSNDIYSFDNASGNVIAGEARSHWATMGFYTRLNWNYNNIYYLEFSGRYDGSSRLAKGHRWGFFPSFSAGWNVAQEPFFERIAEKCSIGTLKLRASWGQLGNTDTKDAWYPFYQTMPTGSNYGWLLNGALPNYANNPGIVSMKKTWETIETWDVGLDWGLFNNRLTGSFDYFVRYTYEMIGPAPELAASLGTGVPKINNADMKSYGFKLELGWRDRIRDFSYGVKFVLSDSQQKILKYPNEDYNIGTYYKGQKLNNIWGYMYDGTKSIWFHVTRTTV